jgi:hypothetical protein
MGTASLGTLIENSQGCSNAIYPRKHFSINEPVSGIESLLEVPKPNLMKK